MYTVIRRYSTSDGALDEIQREVGNTFVPIVRNLPGFIGYYTMNSGQDELVTISVFENQAGADESVRAAANYVKQNPRLSQLIPNAPQVIAGEVIVQEMAGPRPMQRAA